MKYYYLWIAAISFTSLLFIPNDLITHDTTVAVTECYFIQQSVLSPDNPERERRDAQVTPFLTVAIGTEGTKSCSGTICYYDDKTGVAYAIACAHCYTESEECTVRSYFVNGRRKVKYSKAKVIAHDEYNDLSMITFKPSFVPDWVPLGLRESPFFYPSRAPNGVRVIVTGRDAIPDKNDRRPAAYEAFIRRTNDNWYLHSRQSQSYGGRSGGGIMTTNRQWLIAVNYGRDETVNGIGHGLWMPLHRIHKFLKQNDLYWLTKVGNMPQWIPVKGNQRYHKGYMPIPELKEIYVPVNCPEQETSGLKGVCQC